MCFLMTTFWYASTTGLTGNVEELIFVQVNSIDSDLIRILLGSTHQRINPTTGQLRSQVISFQNG